MFNVSDCILTRTQKKVLEKVIEFITFYHGDRKAMDNIEEAIKAKDKSASIKFTPWQEAFIKVDVSMLFALVVAANYLEVKPMLILVCLAVANLIRGKSPQEIRDAFGIKNDLTPEEEERIRKENAWCEEDK
jgi:S-phase kinase-associated protein 1